jgi:hypothetical protein
MATTLAPAFTVGIVQEAVTNDVDENVERAVKRIRDAS